MFILRVYDGGSPMIEDGPQQAGGRQRSPTMTLMEIPPDSPHRTASLSTAVFNLVSTIVGGGVLSLPFAISVQGLAGGVMSLVLSALPLTFLSTSSSHPLVVAARSAKTSPPRPANPHVLTVVLILYSPSWYRRIHCAVRDLLAALVDEFSGSVIRSQSHALMLSLS